MKERRKRESSYQDFSQLRQKDALSVLLPDATIDTADHDSDGKEGATGERSDQNFPAKLHYMLSEIEKDGLEGIVSWQPHGRCFAVHKQDELVEKILPFWFRQTKFASFQRQLNIYGFNRMVSGPDKGAYYHELFLRGKRFLSQRITRMKLKGKEARKIHHSPDHEPNFYILPYLPNEEESTQQDDEGEAEDEGKSANGLGTELPCGPSHSAADSRPMDSGYAGNHSVQWGPPHAQPMPYMIAPAGMAYAQGGHAGMPLMIQPSIMAPHSGSWAPIQAAAPGQPAVPVIFFAAAPPAGSYVSPMVLPQGGDGRYQPPVPPRSGPQFVHLPAAMPPGASGVFAYHMPLMDARYSTTSPIGYHAMMPPPPHPSYLPTQGRHKGALQSPKGIPEAARIKPMSSNDMAVPVVEISAQNDLTK